MVWDRWKSGWFRKISLLLFLGDNQNLWFQKITGKTDLFNVKWKRSLIGCSDRHSLLLLPDGMIKSCYLRGKLSNKNRGNLIFPISLFLFFSSVFRFRTLLFHEILHLGTMDFSISALQAAINELFQDDVIFPVFLNIRIFYTVLFIRKLGSSGWKFARGGF